MEKQKIEKKIDEEMLKLQNLRRMLKGTVNEVVVKNGSAKGKGKVIHQLTYKAEGNITRTLYVKRERLEEAKEMVINHKKAKEALNRILELNAELFKLESLKPYLID